VSQVGVVSEQSAATHDRQLPYTGDDGSVSQNGVEPEQSAPLGSQLPQLPSGRQNGVEPEQSESAPHATHVPSVFDFTDVSHTGVRPLQSAATQDRQAPYVGDAGSASQNGVEPEQSPVTHPWHFPFDPQNGVWGDWAQSADVEQAGPTGGLEALRRRA
jgi:hypothetical protein